ncbi:branched-chain amino acid ABC transporter ATP-binding protein/permease [Phytohabitans houttuyneae]|uniref:Metal-dependent hydrolase n=1 Tax=Phytohabitans houttuyneae TaxID=1076126 RepID=A0A6V8KLW4_9ACTN|nr:branched-chain amino acid ABC transporter ATP-binding protein/permease [Phytohabitans houttuyneae]GFJ86123.1 metal-dependent hydrolase [Phytohabitans houttuyneae]
MKWAALPLAALVLYPVIRPFDAYQQTVLLLAFLLAVQAVSWNIISGYAGYVSLGHSAFLGLGSYTAGIVGVHTGLNPFLAAPLGGIVAVLGALVLGAVVLRARGHAFVIITIALLLAMQVVATNWSSLTNGSNGITLELPFWSRDFQNVPFYYFFLLLMFAAIGFSWAIRRTKFGTGLVAIREDEGKAAAIGVDTTRYKIVAFCCSTFFVGMAGAGYAYFLTFLNPVGAFGILGSVTIVLAALVGGRGTLWGPVIGAFIVQIASELATVYGGGSQSRVLLFGVALVLVVLFLPAGLLPAIAARVRRGSTVEFIDQSGALASARVEVHVPEAPPGPILEVRGVSKGFGGLVAVDGTDVTVQRGSVTALIGPNGSGKTTLFNLVTGAMRADAGEIWFDGRRIDRLPPWTRGHLGLGRTFQVTRLFRSMTVLQNVVAPLPDARWRTMLAGAVRGHEADRARELLGFVGLARFADQPAGSLSYGQQKLVELAQVLMMEPKLVLLDEPAGGVNPSLVGRICDIVRGLNEQGVTFLVVEHNIPMVLGLCDPVVVFSRGRPIAEGPPAAIRNDPLVLDAYLGEEAGADAYA